jgi:hypothetical protein
LVFTTLNVFGRLGRVVRCLISGECLGVLSFSYYMAHDGSRSVNCGVGVVLHVQGRR